MKHLGDITKISGYNVPAVDIVVGGSPCQDLSVAGKREGLAGARSGLFMEQVRIVKEMRDGFAKSNRGTNEHIRPRFMVWENVTGAFSSNKGEDFRAVLEEVARIADKTTIIPRSPKGKWNPSGAIMGDGWSIAWRVHDAQFWGVPQRRKRIALVADFGGDTAPEILFERKGVSGDITESGKEGQGTTTDVERSIGEASKCLNSWDVQSKHIQPENGIAEALYSGECRGGGGEQYVMQDKPMGDGYVESETMYKLNSTERHAVMAQSWNGSQVSPTLTANNANGSQRMPDKENFNAVISFGNGQLHDVMSPSEEVSKTLNFMVDPAKIVTYGLDRASFNQGANAQYDFRVEEEKIGTQVAKGSGAVCQSIVRRLTPMECERLQGFPDGWTDIGEWTDTKGKKHKGESDSPRYKALGNSIALPFWEWMAKRMRPYLGNNPTMASLFDGIGGFPLVFTRADFTPVWASEIEEFPMAVTKLRFPSEEE